MHHLAVTFKNFAGDESGATAIEYGLIAALVAVAMLVAILGLGGGVRGLFTHVGNTAGNAMDTAG